MVDNVVLKIGRLSSKPCVLMLYFLKLKFTYFLSQVVEEIKKRKGLKPGPASLDNYLDKM